MPSATPSEKTPQRTLRWARICSYVDKQADHAKQQSGEGYADMLIEFCREEQARAVAERYDDTVTYLQHIIDDMQSFKQKLKHRPAECTASGAGHADGPHGPHGEVQCAYCGRAPSPDTPRVGEHNGGDYDTSARQAPSSSPPLERIKTPPLDCGKGMQGYLTSGIMEYQSRLWECHSDGTMTPATDETYRRLGVVSTKKL